MKILEIILQLSQGGAERFVADSLAYKIYSYCA